MRTWKRGVCAAALVGCALVAGPHAQERQALDPKILTYTLPENIRWVADPGGGAERLTLFGDPSKPGPYAQFVKWKAGNMSRPHFHETDRHIVVISGTWWVGTGATFSPDTTVPLPAGTYVVHAARGVHYDGAKQGDAVLLIQGVGPAVTIPAEKR
jgi:hypothetical protein